MRYLPIASLALLFAGGLGATLLSSCGPEAGESVEARPQSSTSDAAPVSSAPDTSTSTPAPTEAPVDYDAYADLVIPPLSPDDALETFELEDGFTIELVAHEPMLVDPVAMDIDADGRLWVVEMRSYMPVHDESDRETSIRERVPQGRVLVLEDTTGDGVMDQRTIFRDQMILPRAIKVLDHGVLVAEPPRLWYIEDTTGDGHGDTRTIVHESYGNPESDNVEHMPNGLMWAMDNWIYSAHSGVPRYRKTARGQFQHESFPRLGQWGFTQDNWGRLFSAHNSTLLQTHLPPHGYGLNSGKNHTLTSDGEVWPAHVTGVNRGYQDRVLRDDGTLRSVTAVSGPVIYRGGLFGDDYIHNAFIPEPAGNLIKRVRLTGDPGDIRMGIEFAYRNREFLTSTDERFRPVNLYNAPDGSIYVVDMYRGIFQHARFLTDYLRDYAVEHDLHKPVGKFGRIYRIRPTDAPIDYDTPALSEKSPVELADYLQSPHGQLRDAAQQLLVQRSPEQAISSLETLALNRDAASHARMHAIWTLAGYDREVLSVSRLAQTAMQMLDDPHPRARAHAVRVLEPALAEQVDGVVEALGELATDERAPWVELQLLASLAESPDERALPIMAELTDRRVDDGFFREMARVRLRGRELEMAQSLANRGWSADHNNPQARELFEHFVNAADGEIEVDPLAGWSQSERELFELGRQRYAACAACHGDQGEGMQGVGTALAGSAWVTGDARSLIRIVLDGFEGGAAERDEEVFAAMVPHRGMNDDDLAAVITYVRNAWDNDAGPVTPEQIQDVRGQGQRDELWTPEALRELQ